MNKKRVIIFFIIILFSISVFSAELEDAKYIYLEKYYKINPDGSWILKYSSKVKLNTYLATRRLFGETFIVYNPKYQNLEVIKSRTIMKDGKIVPTPKNGYNEVLPRAAHTFPDFSFLREMVVSHTGLERGAIEELTYKIKTKNDFSPYFFTIEKLAENVPVKKLKIVFDTPSNLNLSFSMINTNIKPTVENRDGRKIYRFEINNVRKSNYFSGKDIPAIFAYTDCNALYNLFKSEKLSDNLAKTVEKIRNKSKDNYQLLLNIQKFVSDEIQNVHLNISETGFHFRDINTVFKTRYGTEVEKTKLLYSILSYLKMKPEILIFSPFKNRKILSPYDKFFVKVKIKNESLYLDPVNIQNEFYPFGYASWNVYDLENKKINFKSRKSEDNKLQIIGTISLEKGKFSEIYLKKTGVFNNYRKTLKNEKSFASKILKEHLNMSRGEIKRVSFKTPYEFSGTILAKGSPFKIKNSHFLVLNSFKLPFISDLNFNKINSSSIIHIRTPFKACYNLKIKIPENSEIDYIAKPLKIENRVGKYERVLTKENNSYIGLKVKLVIYKKDIRDKKALETLYKTVKKDKIYLILLKK